MNRLIAAAVVAFCAGEAGAGTLSCSFTEPFSSIEFDSETGKITQTTPEDFDEATQAFIPREIARNAVLELTGAMDWPMTVELKEGGRTILTLRPTGQGSDGMSDLLFPFEAMFGEQIGGCETGRYPALDPFAMLEDLGVGP